MTGVLDDWVNGGDTALRWIEPNGYATQAYAGGDSGWMAGAQTMASTLAQANGALGSQVLSLDVMPALRSAAPPPDEDAEPLDTAEAVVEANGALESARTVAKACHHTLSGQVDLVLRLPSPSGLLVQFGAAADNLSFDDLDDAAMLVANLVRGFSDYPFAGVMLASETTDAIADDEFESLDSILATARHYRWLTILRLESDIDAETAARADVDLLLMPHQSPSQLAAHGGLVDGRRVGGGLSAAFWHGQNVDDCPSGALFHGDAPGDIAPEQVLERIRSLP